jgi:hypothetical protein
MTTKKIIRIAASETHMYKISSYSLKRQKKAIITLEEAIILGLVAFLVIVSFGFFNKLQASVLSQKDDGSIANFDRLYNNVEKLLESQESEDYLIDNYFLGNNRRLVGFDTEWDEQREIVELNIRDDLNLYKPFKCGNSACICLYNNDWDPENAANRDKGVLGCRSETFSGKNVLFSSEGSDITPKTKGIARQDARDNYLIFFGENFKIQRIYIEKIYLSDQNKYLIYISRIDEDNNDDPVTKRKQIIDTIHNSRNT